MRIGMCCEVDAMPCGKSRPAAGPDFHRAHARGECVRRHDQRRSDPTHPDGRSAISIAASERLITAANEEGGVDNISVVLARVEAA